MRFNVHNEFIEANVSEKIVLAHVNGVKRLFNFAPDGSVYSKTTEHFVVGVCQGTTGTELLSVPSLAELTDSTKFYYDIPSSKLYLFAHDPIIDEVIVTYRFFYSNAPINLSWNLEDFAPEVEYSPRIDSAPAFKSSMAQDKKGISLIGTGTLSLENADTGLNGIYGTITWDNNSVKIYSTNRDLPPSQAKLIFDGIISNKSFNSPKIDFTVKDSIYALETKIPLIQYGELTRDADSLNFKRQVYGRVDNMLIQSIDQVGDGYPITGTIAGRYEEEVLKGTGTLFKSEITNGDTLIFDGFELSVGEVLSDTLLKVSSLERTFISQAAKVRPALHYNNKNRIYQVAGHALKRWSTNITQIIHRNRIIVDSTEGFEALDNVTIGTEVKKIRRVSGNTIVLQTNFNLDHTVGTSVTKTEITNVRYGANELLIPDSSVTIFNDSTGAKIQLASNAEFKVARQKTFNTIFRFVNGKSKVWLGSPSFINITCTTSTKTGTGPTDYSLMGKWFSLKDEAGNDVGFWIKDSVKDSQTTVPKPPEITAIAATNGGKIKTINLESRPYTSTEIAQIVAEAIASNLSCWQFNLSANIINLESVETLDIASGNMGTSGFTQLKTLMGVPAASQINLTKIFKTRDFIKSTDDLDTGYLEILAVDEKSLTLRNAYTGASKLQNLHYKNIEYISDTTPVYVDCYGKTKDGEPTGEWIETAPEAVYDVLKQIGLENRIDVESFNASIQRSPYQLSMCIPLRYRATSLPAAKEVINLLNQTTIGSLHITEELKLGYDILDAHIDLDNLRRITDSDVISWSVTSDAFDLSSTTVTNYRHSDYNPKLGRESNLQTSHESHFAKLYTKSTNTQENATYLYKESDASETTQRSQFINDISSSIIKIKGSLGLSKFQIGERVIIDFHGLYKSYGSNSSELRIGIISAISSNGEKTDIEVLDLGSLFSRASRIIDDSAPDYANSSEYERLINSFITEDNGIVDGDESTAGSNLIS